MQSPLCALSALRCRLLLAALPVLWCLAGPMQARAQASAPTGAPASAPSGAPTAARPGAGPANVFHPPIDTPAKAVPAPARSPMLAVTAAGPRLVGVGLRGLVAWSDDAGKTWTQASVPVQVDLTAVSFPTPQHGWAVGHRGVVLESQDGGASWTRRFAGLELAESAVRHYEAQAQAQPQAKPQPQPQVQPQPQAQPDAAAAARAESPAARGLAQAQRAVTDGSPPSLLDVWFDSPTSGTLVGTFNTLFRTEDGGKTWLPWMDRIDNPDELHFFAVRGDAAGLYLTGERGNVWRLDADARRWVAVPTGYAGTLFGLVAQGPRVLAYGMRGSVFLSEDGGRKWQQVPTPRKAGFATGLRLRGGDILLVDQTGELLRSQDDGRSFAVQSGAPRVLAYALAQAGEGQVLVAGPAGLGTVPLARP